MYCTLKFFSGFSNDELRKAFATGKPIDYVRTAYKNAGKRPKAVFLLPLPYASIRIKSWTAGCKVETLPYKVSEKLLNVIVVVSNCYRGTQ